MPVFTDGQKITQTEWTRLIQSISASYVIWKDGSTYRAESTLSGGTDYAESTFAAALQNAHDALSNGGRIHIRLGTYQTATGVTISNKKIMITGEGYATKIQPTADIDVFTISPSAQTGEEGVGVKISDLYFYDAPSSPAQTSKAMIVLDNSSYKFSGVTLENILMENCYDGIKNNRGTSDNDCWAHTLRNIKMNDFRHNAIHWQNIADTVHENTWLTSAASTDEGMLVEAIAGGSGKYGGNTFNAVRIFNSKATGGMGMLCRDTHEMWFNNCIFDFCDSDGFKVDNCQRLFLTNCWSSTNGGRGYLFEGQDGSIDNIQMSNCYAWDNDYEGFLFSNNVTNVILDNCIAFHNDIGNHDKFGFYLNDATYCRLTGCLAYDSGTATQYGGIAEDNTNSDYNVMINCVAYGNTNVQIAVYGAHSEKAHSVG